MATDWSQFEVLEQPTIQDTNNIAGIIEDAADRYGVPRELALSMAQQESSLNPGAVGPETRWGRAKGLFQYLDSTAKSLNIDPLDPVQAADAAMWQLASEAQKGGWEWAVAHHHAGPDPKQHGPKTAQYVRQIFDRAGIGADSVAQPEEAPQVDWSSFEPLANFSGVKASVDTTASDTPTPTLPERNLTALDRTGTALAAGLGDVAADVMYRDIDAEAAEQVRKQKEEERIASSPLPEPLARVLYTDILSPLTNKMIGKIANTGAYKGAFGALSEYVQKAREEVAGEVERVRSERPVQGFIERAITDVAGSPQSLASIPGGPFAVIPGLTSFNDSYRAAREAGATPEEATDYAGKQALVEGGISAIPAGKILGTVVKPAGKLAAPLAGRLARTARTAAGESIEESVQQLAQEGITRYTAETTDDEKLKTFAADRISKDLLGDVFRAGAAGFVGGGSIGGIQGSIEYAADAGRQAHDTTKAALGQFDKERGEAEKNQIQFDQELNRQLAEELAKKQATEAQDKLDAEAAKQKALEEEAGFQTIERDKALRGQTVVRESREGVLTREPVNPPREVLPEQIQEQQEAVVEEIKAAGEKAAPAPKKRTKKAPKPKPDAEVSDNEIAALTSQLGLGMQESTAPESVGDFNRKAFESKASGLIKNLVKKNTQPTADVQNLLRQGKLVLAPNAQSIGREASDNVAEYDPKANKMYLYTDKVSSKDVVGVMARALHESTHAGQFNDRQGRPDIFKQMMSPDKENAASQKILALNGKNALATNAVRLAKKASPDTAIQDLELVPYFVSEVTKARSGVLGRLRGVASDITSSAKTFLKDKLGVDFDVSLNDLASASQRIAGEIVQTDTTESREGDTLAMVLGRNAENYNKAYGEDRVYYGAKDKSPRFVISDAKAETVASPEVIDELEAGKRLPLGEVLAHDELYNNYPDLAEYSVMIDPKIKDARSGYFSPSSSTIFISRAASKLLDTPDVRNLILHETQHAVQTKEGHVMGASPEAFVPKELRARLQRVNDNMDKLIAKFDVGTAINTLPPEARRYVQQVRAQRNLSREQVAEYILAQGLYDLSTDRTIKQFGEIAYKQARNLQNETAREFNEVASKAFQTYLRDYGETEARTTEMTSRFTQEELDQRAFEDRFGEAPGNISVERTLDTAPFVGTAEAPASVPVPLYRETNADGAVDMIEGMTRNLPGLSTKKNSVFASTSPDLALGQGNNKGIMLKLDPIGYNSTQNNNKPVAGFLNDQGNSEVILTNKPDVNSGEYVMSVTLNKGWKAQGDRNYAERLLLRMRQNNWLRNENEDGSITYTNPKYLKSLGMAEQSEARSFRIPSIVTSLFDSAQGTGKNINEIVEYARSSPAGARMQAEASLGNYTRSLEALAKEEGRSPQELNEEISKALDEIDSKSDSYEANRKAFNSVASKYGKAGQALIELRDQIDDLTMDILRQRAANGNPLTEAEKKTYKTLVNNLGRYAHRQYASNIGKAGRKYADTVWKDYEKVKKGKKDDPKSLANYKKVADAVSFLVDNNLRIPPDEELDKLGADKTRSLYSTWGRVGNSEGMSLENMKLELAASRDAINGNKNSLEAEAESITRELLGLAEPNKAITSYYRGGKQDDSILRERQHLPKQLRDLMGEITDPGMRLMTTVAKQAEFVSRNRMLLELRDQAGEQHVQPPNAPGDVRKGMQKLEGKAWGPLEGYYVSSQMRNLVGDTVQQLATFEQAVAMAAVKPGVLSSKTVQKAVETWGNITAASKGLQIVGNPINFLYNFIGAPRMLLSNGNLNPKNTLKAWKTSAELIAYAMDPSTATQEAMRANKYGVTDSAFIGEIKNAEYRQLGKVVKQMAGKTPSEAMATLKTLGVGAKELYAMMDVWSKLANFYHQADVLEDFYKKEGIEKTQDEIDREAADNVNRTNITYKRAAPLVKALERGGITQFGTYFYEVFRSEVANTLQGIDELRRANNAITPEGRNAMIMQGTKRLAGQATSWALTAAMAKYLSGQVFGDDDDENQDKRALLPEWLQNQDFIEMGTDAKGNKVLFNIARLDPIGPMTDIMRSALHEDVSADQVAKNFFDLYVAPRVGTQLITALAVMAGDGPNKLRQPTVQQVAPDAYSQILRVSDTAGIEDRTAKAWTNVVEAFLPGIATSYRANNVRPVPQDATSATAAALTYMGASMYKLDPKAAAKSASFDYSNALKNARRDAKDIFTDHPEGLPENELISRLIDLRQNEKEAFDKLHAVYKGMESVGMTKAQAGNTLRANNISTGAIGDLRRGEFQSHIVSKESIQQYMKDEMNGKTRKEKKEIKQKWNEAYKLLKAADKSINEGEEA